MRAHSGGASPGRTHGRSALPGAKARTPRADREGERERTEPGVRSRSDEVGAWAYRTLWGATLILLAFGLLMVFSASSVVGLFRDNPEGLYYLRQQALMAGFGLVLLFVLSRIDYRRWRSLAVPALVINLLLLAAVGLPGMGRDAGGATRWLDLGFVSLQPSELSKLVVMVLGAYLLSTRRALRGGPERLLLPLGPVAGIICLLILFQPDLGTALMVAAVVMGLWWIAGLAKTWWFGLAGAGFLLGSLLIFSADYRRERFFAFLDPQADPQGSGFQIIQSFVAMGSGGLFGVGPGRSIQKFNYLPEAHTDMIFAIIGEEFGLLGAGLVILLFGALSLAAWRIASQCRDLFGKYLAAGALFLVSGQALLNMGGVLGVLPLTGVPLPFISFGRTNLVVMLAGIGLILSVARFGPVASPAEETAAGPEGDDDSILEKAPDNVTYLDRRRRHRRTRGAGAGRR